MDVYKVFEGRQSKLLGIMGILLVMFMFGVFRYLSAPDQHPANEDALTTQIEAARQEGYDRGYKTGYEAAYQEAYQTARKEIGNGALTTYGITGLTLGLLIGVGGVAALNRKILAARIKAWQKTYELKKAFQTIPPNLSPDIAATAEQIARTYSNILEQFRSGKGYMASRYITEWRLKLKVLMEKSVQLMELIQELETTRQNVDAQKLERTMHELRETVRHARDDETRNTAVKSLKRAKQTHADLHKAQLNIDHCKTALKGITGVLDSMHLKLSNIKVNTQQTDQLDELSTDLQVEMSALEEALQEIAPGIKTGSPQIEENFS